MLIMWKLMMMWLKRYEWGREKRPCGGGGIGGGGEGGGAGGGSGEAAGSVHVELSTMAPRIA